MENKKPRKLKKIVADVSDIDLHNEQLNETDLKPINKSNALIEQDKPVKVKKSNPWIEHCRNYAKDNNCSYGQAVIMAKDSYKKNKE